MNQALFQSWLILQCRTIPGARRVLARVDGWGPGREGLRASIPARVSDCQDLEDMLKLAQNGRRMVIAGTGETGEADHSGLRLAHPLLHAKQPIGAVVVELERSELSQQAKITPILKWGNAWLELLLSQQGSEGLDDLDLQRILKPVLDAISFQESALAAVGLVAHRCSAERASIGVHRNGKVQPVVLSESSGFSPRSELARQLGEAMNECLSLGAAANWPGDDSGSLTAHRSLAESQADGGILSVPLPGEGGFGVLTVEFGKGKTCDSRQQADIERIARILGPVLALKKAREYSLWSRSRRRLADLCSQTFARHRLLAPISLVSALMLLFYLLSATSVYQVGGPAELQGEVQRALIAPFDGYVAKAHARAGERVEKDQLLAELDDRELLLELRQLEGDLSELHKEYRKALAGLDHSEAKILQAQKLQAEARIELLQQYLRRTRLLAPFAAVVVTGDLSRSLGKPVERGEVLFELAPLDAYRVEIEVPDKDIAAVANGQAGSLVLAASPTDRLPIEVVNVTSMPGKGIQPGSFRVEARLLENKPQLRPGMRGVAKLAVGDRPRIWIWTHELIDWLRYRIWAWLP